MSAAAPRSLARAAELVQPALREAVAGLADDHLRRVTSYQLGWCSADGAPTSGHGGKGLRGALVVLTTEALGHAVTTAVPLAAAVELIHNFSLLHDDVMDRDLLRRHRPTGWAVYGEGAAILAGTAMLALAAQVVGESAPAALPCLLDATQRLVSGQSQDLLLEAGHARGAIASPEAVLQMEAGKTAALLECAASIGPLAAGAPRVAVDALAVYGHDLGMAFQLVDDLLGITGDPASTGKSASSDLRSGKQSAPIAFALARDDDAGRRLRHLFGDGPLATDDEITLAAKLVDEAGGLEWTRRRAREYTERALASLDGIGMSTTALAELTELAGYLLERDR